MTSRIEHAVAAIAFLVGVLLLFATAPHHGEFWWSDAPRHALNGAFVKDMVAAMPAHPSAWAMQYYVKYPALTILFYPPLFYLFLAPFYALFGVSHVTALVVELLHYSALAFGLYVLARRWVSPLTALAVGLSAMAAPGIALWGRQVMLEVPSVAFAVWSAVLLESHLASGRSSRLYLAVFLLLCATYIKITTIFLFPVFALVLIVAQGRQVLRNRQMWLAVAFAIIGLLPIAALTLKFGRANVQSLTGIPDARVARDSIAGWIWYARQMPWQLGWPLLVLAAAAVPLGFAGRLSRRLNPADLTLLGGWIVEGYLFLSAIDLKEARHALVFLPMVLVAAGLGLDALLPARAAGVALMVLVTGTGVYTWRDAPTPFVDGYREAAEWIAREAPKNAVVVFSGKRDGSFIFNMRTIEARRDISIIRSDKLLLDIAVRRTIGVQQKDLSEQQIEDLLDHDGVSYVVAQDDFWTDLPEMSRFQAVLRSPHFQAVDRIPVVANVPTEDQSLTIYRNVDEVSPGPHMVDLHLPIIGETVTGTVGK
ncbi:MAG TPA: glycosyltransferase family 39 protein [Acetobacteraceae bacterium]|nr:glycosyltransferase family 39 protein [Acetobacteraceae bacterium]